MREIKFRAWDKDEKVMRYNIQNAYDGLSGMSICDKDGNEIEYLDSHFKEVLENKNYEVMQFTGLYDKNGVKIWEGDIVKPTDVIRCPYQVYWNETRYIFSVEAIKDIYFAHQDLYEHTWEVIGNIYEYPTLMEKGA